jgi:hypothetical protein
MRPQGLRPPPQWRRLADVHGAANLALFQGEFAEAGDIVQGNLGTCFFLGSLGALAYDEKGLIRQVFSRPDERRCERHPAMSDCHASYMHATPSSPCTL